MATRDLAEWHDQESGDDIHYRDKELVDATEAESANDLTSEWEVLLKSGQTGKLKTAMMSYIDQKVREAMGALVNNLDKGASISKVLATDANNDLGTITPANLALVLSAPVQSVSGRYHMISMDCWQLIFNNISGSLVLSGTLEDGTDINKTIIT